MDRKEREINMMRQECSKLKIKMAEEKVKSGLSSAVNSNSKIDGLLSMRSTSAIDNMRAAFGSNPSTDGTRLFQETKSPYKQVKYGTSNYHLSQTTHLQDDLN